MLAVIVINYKSESRTIAFVKEELARISIPHKVIVVNNGASSESDGMLVDALDAQIAREDGSCDISGDCFVISSQTNRGFAGGNNIGATFAVDRLGAEYILFSNNDIRFLDEDVVERLVDKLDLTPSAGMIGPRVVGIDGKLQSPEPFMSFWDRRVWMYVSTLFLSKEEKAKRFSFNYSEHAQEGFHYKLMGSFFLVRSCDFLSCGMMDENTFLYCEEPILTERMKKIGLQPYYYPSVSVLHDHGATVKKNISRIKQNDILFKSECYYYKTYLNTPWYEILVGRVVHGLVRLL